mmetsp:Transcript_21868/g.25070  ORF Transcript_21868/g.25070 Transcript_21868/m.25070 type:complete len:908 (-) Transcript_21868:48-2771(-)
MQKKNSSADNESLPVINKNDQKDMGDVASAWAAEILTFKPSSAKKSLYNSSPQYNATIFSSKDDVNDQILVNNNDCGGDGGSRSASITDILATLPQHKEENNPETLKENILKTHVTVKRNDSVDRENSIISATSFSNHSNINNVTTIGNNGSKSSSDNDCNDEGDIDYGDDAANADGSINDNNQIQNHHSSCNSKRRIKKSKISSRIHRRPSPQKSKSKNSILRGSNKSSGSKFPKKKRQEVKHKASSKNHKSNENDSSYGKVLFNYDSSKAEADERLGPGFTRISWPRKIANSKRCDNRYYYCPDGKPLKLFRCFRVAHEFMVLNKKKEVKKQHQGGKNSEFVELANEDNCFITETKIDRPPVATDTSRILSSPTSSKTKTVAAIESKVQLDRKSPKAEVKVENMKLSSSPRMTPKTNTDFPLLNQKVRIKGSKISLHNSIAMITGVKGHGYYVCCDEKTKKYFHARPLFMKILTKRKDMSRELKEFVDKTRWWGEEWETEKNQKEEDTEEMNTKFPLVNHHVKIMEGTNVPPSKSITYPIKGLKSRGWFVCYNIKTKENFNVRSFNTTLVTKREKMSLEAKAFVEKTRWWKDNDNFKKTNPSRLEEIKVDSASKKRKRLNTNSIASDNDCDHSGNKNSAVAPASPKVLDKVCKDDKQAIKAGTFPLIDHHIRIMEGKHASKSSLVTYPIKRFKNGSWFVCHDAKTNQDLNIRPYQVLLVTNRKSLSLEEKKYADGIKWWEKTEPDSKEADCNSCDDDDGDDGNGTNKNDVDRNTTTSDTDARKSSRNRKLTAWLRDDTHDLYGKEVSQQTPTKITSCPPPSTKSSKKSLEKKLSQSPALVRRGEELKFPKGWKIKRIPRKNSSHVDRYFYSPKKEIQFRSKKAALKFIDLLKICNGNEEAAKEMM